RPDSQADELPLGRRAVQRLERAHLTERVLAPEQRLRLAADRVAEILELEPVRVEPLDLDPLDPAAAAQLDAGVEAVPRVVDEERALAPERLELVALAERRAAVEQPDDVAREAHRRREHPVGAGRPVPRLGRDALRLAGEQP